MTTRLGDLLLDEETALAFRAWLDELVERQRQDKAKVEAEIERDARDNRYYEKLVAIAAQWADDHGPVAWMDAYVQANAAYEAWEQGAGYFDVDEHLQLDAEWRESWVNAYVSRIEELKKRVEYGISN